MWHARNCQLIIIIYYPRLIYCFLNSPLNIHEYNDECDWWMWHAVVNSVLLSGSWMNLIGQADSGSSPRATTLFSSWKMPTLVTQSLNTSHNVSSLIWIQTGFIFLVQAYPGCPVKEAAKWYTHTHTHTHLTVLCLDFTEARDSEWQWHQLGQMQVCTSLQTDNHSSFLQAGCSSCCPTNSVKTLKANKWYR